MVNLGMRALVAAAAMGMVTNVDRSANVRDDRPKRAPTIRKAARQEPNGLTFKSLRRAFNSGWEAPRPTEKAKLRHAWYRRELAKKAIAVREGG